MTLMWKDSQIVIEIKKLNHFLIGNCFTFLMIDNYITYCFKILLNLPKKFISFVLVHTIFVSSLIACFPVLSSICNKCQQYQAHRFCHMQPITYISIDAEFNSLLNDLKIICDDFRQSTIAMAIKTTAENICLRIRHLNLNLNTTWETKTTRQKCGEIMKLLPAMCAV